MLFLLESFHSLNGKTLQLSVVCSPKPHFAGHSCRPVTPLTLLPHQLAGLPEGTGHEACWATLRRGYGLEAVRLWGLREQGPVLVLFLPTLHLESVFIESESIRQTGVTWVELMVLRKSFPSSALYIRAILSHQPLTVNYELGAGDSMMKDEGTVQILRMRTNKSTHMTGLQ